MDKERLKKMAEHPIIFSSDMIRAILEGRKSQTRRIIRLAHEVPWCFIERVPEGFWFGYGDKNRGGSCLIKPRYQVGDILWAKETHARWSNDHSSIIYSDDPEFASLGKQNVALNKLRASAKTADLMEPVGFWQKVSSRYMHKKDARLWFRVMAILDPHQIQTISLVDCICEGCDDFLQIRQFMLLWNRLHPKLGERWQDSPWVFPYVFERIERCPRTFSSKP